MKSLDWFSIMRKRALQPVSFNLSDQYERELYEYAMEQQKYFSKYIKYIIEKDRSSKVQTAPFQPVHQSAELSSSQDRQAAIDFI